MRNLEWKLDAAWQTEWTMNRTKNYSWNKPTGPGTWKCNIRAYSSRSAYQQNQMSLALGLGLRPRLRPYSNN